MKGKPIIYTAAAVALCGGAFIVSPYSPSTDHCVTAVEDYYEAHKTQILQDSGKSLPDLRDMRCALLTAGQKRDVARQVLAALFPEIMKDALGHASATPPTP